MRADTWRFRACNIVISSAITGVLWLIFNEYIHDILFLFPLYWVMHSRTTRSRLIEISDRLKLHIDVVGELLVGDGSFNYENLLDSHGFHDEADELFGKDDEDDDYPRV